MDILDFISRGRELEAKQDKQDAEMKQALIDAKAMSRKTSPFDFITSIQEKKYILTEQNASHYTPHVVNMGLSQFVGNIGYVLEASILQNNLSGMHTELANKIQYDYLYHSIRKGKQFSKWAKVEKYDNLELIQETYNVNRDEGIKILNRLSDDDLNALIEWDDNKTGGLSK